VGSFGGVKSLLQAARKVNYEISLNDVKEFLFKKRSYTLHKEIRRKFQKLKTTASGIGTSVQCDLLDFSNIKQYNENYNFLLVVVDVFSRLIHAVPLKNKSSKEVLRGLEEIFKDWLYPWAITTDRNDFSSNELKKFYKKHQILKYECFTSSEIHCAIVENVNKQIRSKLERYFTEKDTYKWIDIIDDLIFSLNHTDSRSLGMAPAEVTQENSNLIREKMKPMFQFKEPKFEVGDNVRIDNEKGAFQKGTRQKFSEEIFVIKRVFTNKTPITYEIEDLNGEEIIGKFYDNNFSKVLVDKNTEFQTEEILKTRKRRGKTEWFVKWKGYPSKFNSWINAS